VIAKVADSRQKKMDKRAYTFMLIPHRGIKTRSFSLPIKALKGIGVAFLCVILFVAALQFKHMLTFWHAQAELDELASLRENKENHEEKVKSLIKLTEEMQGEMQKVTRLESEVRRSLGADSNGVSRSGIDREAQGQPKWLLPLNYSNIDNIDEVIQRVKEINEIARQKQITLAALNASLTERNAIRAATPSIWPASGEVTSRFGLRNSPNGMGSSAHKGLDIAGAYGSPVRAAADGIVEISSSYYGYGLYVQIDHGHGLQTAYGHNSELAVSVGEKVKKGQVIAYMGNSGVSTGTHLHYEVIKNGVQVNPANFL
jgi:murein DD-endopeptidase MepM/ murein hydrolase activator NlpD